MRFPYFFTTAGPTFGDRITKENDITWFALDIGYALGAAFKEFGSFDVPSIVGYRCCDRLCSLNRRQ